MIKRDSIAVVKNVVIILKNKKDLGRKYTLLQYGESYYLRNKFGRNIIAAYMLSFIIQIDENRFAYGSGTNNKNSKMFCVVDYDPITGKVEKEFYCNYYGKDGAGYKSIIRGLEKIYHDNIFLLQGFGQLFIYDSSKAIEQLGDNPLYYFDESDPRIPIEKIEEYKDYNDYLEELRPKTFIKLSNIHSIEDVVEGEDRIIVTVIVQDESDPQNTAEVKFPINKFGLPISWFSLPLANGKSQYIKLLHRNAVAKKLGKKVNRTTYLDVLKITLEKFLSQIKHLELPQKST